MHLEKRVLVTGGAGFLGAQWCERLLEHNVNVICADNFFSGTRAMPPEELTRMTNIDYAREMAIIAVRDTTDETAGVARLVCNDTDGERAEFALAVEPAAKGRGLATALMRTLINWGKAQGVKQITGQILADNTPMLAFIRRFGFTIEHIAGESDIVEAKLSP